MCRIFFTNLQRKVRSMPENQAYLAVSEIGMKIAYIVSVSLKDRRLEQFVSFSGLGKTRYQNLDVSDVDGA